MIRENLINRTDSSNSNFPYTVCTNLITYFYISIIKLFIHHRLCYLRLSILAALFPYSICILTNLLVNYVNVAISWYCSVLLNLFPCVIQISSLLPYVARD